MPARLRPSAPIAENAVLCGDPGRAMLLAQELTVQPKMSNHARGLWGYWGVTEGGGELTVQATGTGGPSAALVLSDLAELGLRRAVRVGTCRAIDPELGPGEAIVVTEAFAADGVSRALHLGDRPIRPDADLGAALIDAGAEERCRPGTVWSCDLAPDPNETALAGHDALDLQTAGLFALAPTLEVALAAIVVVAESAVGEKVTEEALEESAKRAGRAAAAALSAAAAPSA